jgi:ABC-type dipeptide/oligopeptide/nickel transport system ATPase component
MTALNPSLRIETQLKEAWHAHAGYTGAAAFAEVVSRALTDVHLPSDRAFLRRYPGQFSVVQAQRVLIAMAILHRPALLIADEATSSLDALTRAGVLSLFQELNRRLNMALLFISHDLPSVLEVSDRVAVLRAGRIVETGSPEKIVSQPVETYTHRLVDTVLSSSASRR